MFVQGCSDVHVSSSVYLISGVPTLGNSWTNLLPHPFLHYQKITYFQLFIVYVYTLIN
jgi:hypothetical protein